MRRRCKLELPVVDECLFGGALLWQRACIGMDRRRHSDNYREKPIENPNPPHSCSIRSQDHPGQRQVMSKRELADFQRRSEFWGQPFGLGTVLPRRENA